MFWRKRKATATIGTLKTLEALKRYLYTGVWVSPKKGYEVEEINPESFEPVHNRKYIKGYEVISEPGAGITLTRIHLTPEAIEGLKSGKKF